MKVWIFQTGEPLHSDDDNSRPMRAMNLANSLVDMGHSVIIWSSAYYHQKKKHRVKKYKKIIFSELLEIRLIPSPGYVKNIGIQRLYDHAVLGINLRKILRNESSKPDVAFIGYPPIEFAYVAQKWLSKNNVKTMLDIKDLWPEIFISFLPKSMKIFGKILLFPYFYLAKQVISNASAVSSMTDSFLNYIMNSFRRSRSKIDLAIPFTSPKIEMTCDELKTAKNWWDKQKLNTNAVFRICYIGNLSPNVDLSPVMQAAVYFEKECKQVEFVICGDGVSFEEYKLKFRGISSVQFTGRINRSQAVALSLISQAALIPYKNSKDFQLSLPNKFIDSLSYKLPIFSPLSGEVAKMIQKYEIGINYGSSFGKSLIEGVNILLDDDIKLKEMAKNCCSLHKKYFENQVVYKNLANHLIEII